MALGRLFVVTVKGTDGERPATTVPVTFSLTPLGGPLGYGLGMLQSELAQVPCCVPKMGTAPPASVRPPEKNKPNRFAPVSLGADESTRPRKQESTDGLTIW